MSTVPKQKKSVDEQISDEIKSHGTKLVSLCEKKFSNSKMNDTEKTFAKLVSNALKQKQEGKVAKTKPKINTDLGVFLGNNTPYKEEYLSLIATLIRASLDAQPKPVQPKTKPSS